MPGSCCNRVPHLAHAHAHPPAWVQGGLQAACLHPLTLSCCHCAPGKLLHPQNLDQFIPRLTQGVPLGSAPLTLQQHRLPDAPWSPQWSRLGFDLPRPRHLHHARRGENQTLFCEKTFPIPRQGKKTFPIKRLSLYFHQGKTR